MNRKILVIISLLLSGALLFWLLPNDEKEIRKNLQQLAKFCSSTKDEGNIATLMNVGKAVKLCSDPCAVEVDSFDIKRVFIHKELSNHLLMMKQMLPDTRLTFSDVQVNFPQKDMALITSTLSLHGKTRNQRFTDAYELDIVALKTEGKWIFSAFTVIEFMER
jgi:hypothetical protein